MAHSFFCLLSSSCAIVYAFVKQKYAMTSVETNRAVAMCRIMQSDCNTLQFITIRFAGRRLYAQICIKIFHGMKQSSFVLHDETVNTYGFRMLTSGANLEEFRKNPSINFEYNPRDYQDETEDEAENEPTQVVSTAQVRAESDESIRRRRQQQQSRKQRQREAEEDEEYYEERRGIPPALIAVLVILLFVGGVFAFLWNSFFSPLFAPTKSYEVPDLLGKTLEEVMADETITSVFEIVEGEPVYDENYELGEIADQSPSAGSSLKETNLTITVNINTEEETNELRMPDVKNYEAREALRLLQDEMGLVVRQEYETSDTVNEGYVIRCSLMEDTKVEPGDEVTIVISEGAKPKTATVPTVEGMTLEEATDVLHDYDLEVGEITEVHSETVEAGRVVLQGVKAATEVEAGTKVNLQVSLGSANPDQSSDPDPDTSDNPTTSDTPVTNTTVKEINFNLSNYTGTIHLKVLVGDTVVMDGEVDTSIGLWSRQVTSSGVQSVKYYVDDVLVRSDTVDFSS